MTDINTLQCPAVVSFFVQRLGITHVSVHISARTVDVTGPYVQCTTYVTDNTNIHALRADVFDRSGIFLSADTLIAVLAAARTSEVRTYR